MGNEEWREVYYQYQIPDEILLLRQIETELSNKGLSLSQIGFLPIDQPETYSITPPDLIPFASTGGGGIHFGFLTEFHSVSNLTEAPIVCVTPTNDPPIRYMARNIREFLDLAFSVPYVEMLETIWTYDNENQVHDFVEEFEKDSPSEWHKNREHIQTRCRGVFGTKKVNVINYFQEVKKERANSICMDTLDGLGVIGEHPFIQTGQHFQLPENRNYEEVDVDRMRSFLIKANKTEKLAFVRDANYWYIVSSGYDESIWELIIEVLISLKLEDEAERVSERC